MLWKFVFIFASDHSSQEDWTLHSGSLDYFKSACLICKSLVKFILRLGPLYLEPSKTILCDNPNNGTMIYEARP